MESETRGEREVREAYETGHWVSPMGVVWKRYRSGWVSQDWYGDFWWHHSFQEYVKMLYPDYDEDN